ncbi:hypothetical protein FDG04_02445 [Clostridium sporogenes]|uniref:hypothetical protein n=1 Tax=Clostridium sporogenes TaxID=1509 RepID=UPI0013D2FEEB|nr:hypothetical protein [Clostridium sporogenes]NFQ84193.1 hypothetical protein [Clostridium sporogenes]
MFNIVNKKVQRDNLCKDIDGVVNLYYSKVKECDYNMSQNDRLKLIGAYNIILFNYADEISYLIKGSKFTTIHSLTRDFLECYSIVSEMIELYHEEDKFDNFQRYLTIQGLKQEVKTLEELKDNMYKSYLNNIDYVKDRLKKDFLKESFRNKPLDEERIQKMSFKDLKLAVNKLQKKYKKGKEDKSKFIVQKLYKNTFLEMFTGKDGIYKELCNYTHMNKSSVEKRVLLKVGKEYVMTNINPDENIPNLLFLIYCCIKDVYEKMNNIIKE